MIQRCAACGYAADKTVRLPEPWVAYLIAKSDFEEQDGNVTIPVCVGCQRTIESFRDPKHPVGDTDPDSAVRAFLDDVTLPDQ